MNNKHRFFLFAALLSAGSFAMAECTKPAVPVIPDGNTAAEDAMIDAQHAVKDYIPKAEQYLDCVVAESKAAQEGNADTPESKKARSDAYDEVFKAREAVPTAFNAELRKFKARPDQQ